MTHKICGARAIIHGKNMICRRRHGHTVGDHHWQTFKGTHHVLLELAARVSDLNVSLPEGDYTSEVDLLYINGRNLMVRFRTTTVEELVAARRKGT